jgi:glycosyltransferase involved in cell wall biosynthesis
VTEPLVSVVTPVYNAEEHLRECIDSILAQTYRNWEYVLVDNSSTDSSAAIAEGYAARDPRIRVVRATEVVPAVANANRAMREVAPESVYCKVVHADDWILPRCLEDMVALAERYPNVGVVGSYRLEGNDVNLDGLPYAVEVIPGPDLCRSTLLGSVPYPYLFGSPTSLLLRSDLVRSRDPFYNADNPFEDDQEACLEVLGGSDFGFVHQVLTYTRRHEGTPYALYVRVGAQLPGQIALLRKFGPVYLTRVEYQRRLAGLTARYLLFLLRSSGRFRRPEFRHFHLPAVTALRSLDRVDLLVGAGHQLRRAARKH